MAKNISQVNLPDCETRIELVKSDIQYRCPNHD